MKYRKKPVEIEAIQLTALNLSEIEEFVGGDLEVRAGQVVIATLEGAMHASLGDWIIRGVAGEFYPCKPDIFAETYEEVDESFVFDPLTHELYQAAEQVREVNEANGWFEEQRSVGEDIALLHSEASEMLEAYREHGLADMTGEVHELHAVNGQMVQAIPPKPEGFGSEAADVLIRLLDTCTRRGVNLGWEFPRKLTYNAPRGHRHGGKRVC